MTALFAGLGAAMTLSPHGVGGQPEFVDATEASGLAVRNVYGGEEKRYILEANGSGAGFFDYDNDGDLDLYVVNGSTFEMHRQGSSPGNVLFRNRADGTFAVQTDSAGVGDSGWGSGVTAGDYDNDGNQDLYVTNYGRNTLYRNSGKGHFADVTEASRVGGDAYSASAAFLDYDEDGDLDLYVTGYIVFDVAGVPEDPYDDEPCIYLGGLRVYCGPQGMEGAADVLYRNEGDGLFTDVTGESGIAAANSYYGLGVVPEDFDNDGHTDLFIANDETPNCLFRNNADGTFTDVADDYGVAHNADGEEESGMGVDAADYDGDGDVDIYVSNFFRETNTLYRNERPGWFVDATEAIGLAAPTLNRMGWGTRFLDFDNDSDLDLFVANGHSYPQVDRVGTTTYAQANQLFANDGEGRFEEVSAQAGPGLAISKVSRGACSGDYDRDGDVDIFVVNLNDTPTLLRNDGGDDNHWLTVRTVGTRDNRDGKGTRILLKIDSQVQWRTVNGASSYLSHNEAQVHFGMGRHRRGDVEVIWLDGTRHTYRDVAANTVLIARQDD